MTVILVEIVVLALLAIILLPLMANPLVRSDLRTTLKKPKKVLNAARRLKTIMTLVLTTLLKCITRPKLRNNVS